MVISSGNPGLPLYLPTTAKETNHLHLYAQRKISEKSGGPDRVPQLAMEKEEEKGVRVTTALKFTSLCSGWQITFTASL